MSEQLDPLVVTQLILKFLKLLRFWKDPEHNSVIKRSQRPKFMSGVSHLKKAEKRLKTCEDHTFCRESYGQSLFLEFSWCLIHEFSDKLTNHQLSFLKTE